MTSRDNQARAWDKDGHEAIGMTAMSALKGKALAQLKRLMGGKDAVDVSEWAHKVNKQYPWTTALHFQPQPGGEPDTEWRCDKIDVSECPDNKCLLAALKHFYGRLTGKKLVEMKYPEGIHFTDADCLKYLINLIGDLHQPLHVGFKASDMGRAINGTFKNKPHSLYEIWDTTLTQTMMAERPGFWYGGWTHVNSVKSQYENDKKEWAEKDFELFERWASESLQVACNKVYKDPTQNVRLVPDFKTTPHMERQWGQEMQQRILTAGARLVIVLNSILEQQEAKKLRQGSGVEVQGEEEHKAKPRVPAWVRNLGTNLIIIVVVLGVFIYISQFYGGPASTASPQSKKVEAKETAKHR
ncbi:unnamed protein product [Vitrella brassicaformis CCMP3155]|uniref:Uncharacterized protein n=2 Tax=Vitrella brassicaformis TaxID=1169539 RepID=A0A0G4GD50_VITBC|nr:unnamed protein product [Vitrella brassicaformis CCMP3155]|eukprot:CEM27184.1 unnamed protein product [Vitrella brassicaformis CCMP3155]